MFWELIVRRTGCAVVAMRTPSAVWWGVYSSTCRVGGRLVRRPAGAPGCRSDRCQDALYLIMCLIFTIRCLRQARGIGHPALVRGSYPMIYFRTVVLAVSNLPPLACTPLMVSESVSPLASMLNLPVTPSKSLVAKTASRIAPRSFLQTLLIAASATLVAS